MIYYLLDFFYLLNTVVRCILVVAREAKLSQKYDNLDSDSIILFFQIYSSSRLVNKHVLVVVDLYA